MQEPERYAVVKLNARVNVCPCAPNSLQIPLEVEVSQPISPKPVSSRGEKELPAYVSNGLIGLRVRDVPLSAGMALVSGFAGEHPERFIEAAATAPYPLAGDVAINGIWLSDAPTKFEILSKLRFRNWGTYQQLQLHCVRPESKMRGTHVRQSRRSDPGLSRSDYIGRQRLRPSSEIDTGWSQHTWPGAPTDARHARRERASL